VKPIAILAVAGALAASMCVALAQGAQAPKPMVRIAELEIDPAQLGAYKAMLAEEVEASVRLEPGVLMLHAVSINDNPAHIRLLEVYASQRAYEAHLKSPQFVKYKLGTAPMVKSLRLVSTTPIKLCAKSNLSTSGVAHCM
jgi:quinol monooxygenase YgiN